MIIVLSGAVSLSLFKRTSARDDKKRKRKKEPGYGFEGWITNFQFYFAILWSSQYLISGRKIG